MTSPGPEARPTEPLATGAPWTGARQNEARQNEGRQNEGRPSETRPNETRPNETRPAPHRSGDVEPGLQPGYRRAAPSAGQTSAAQRRRGNGRRAPGAHRASSPDGLIPGFRRSRGRDERDSRRTPEVEPYPADLPVPGNAGLAAEGYGLTTEGELTEAEFAEAERRRAGPAATPNGVASPSLVRSSGVMALGTMASRVTGMVRTVVLVPAIGAYALANSYNVANTLPNTVYNLAIGGILTSVIVPLLVNAAKRDKDQGERYSQRMFTLVTVTLAVITLAATVAAGPIATLFGCASKACSGSAAATDYRHVLVIFSYFFIPQIFFYGVSSLAGAILNARGHFAAPMWTPVVNNVVVIAVTIAFIAVAGLHQTVSSITPFEVRLLGIGTTLGIVAQTAALIPALRRVGFRWRPRFDFKRADVSEIGRMAGWMFGYILTTQVAFFVTVKVADTANIAGQTHGVGAGYTAYLNAWMLFQLPYAIVAISVITALLPRMSANASDRRYDRVQADFSTGVRLGSVIVAPAALVLAVLGPSLGAIMFGWGDTSVASARYFGLVFSVFSLGLVPYMLFQLLLRVFYSLHDSKTPALIGVLTMFTNVGANLVALAIFPPHERVAALGVGFGLANLAGSTVAWRVVSRRLGGLAGRQIGRSLLRMHVAAVPAALFALAVAVTITGVFSTGKGPAAAIVALGGGGALVFYWMFSRALRVPEVADLTGMVRSRLHR